MGELSVETAPAVAAPDDTADTAPGSRAERVSMMLLRRHWLVLLLVLAQLLVALDVHLPVVRPVLALATLLGLPTLVLLRRAGLPAETATARLLLAFGLSLLGLLLGGLLLNTLLPHVGVQRPLQPAVLGVTWLVVDLGLLRWRADLPLLPRVAWARVGRRVLDARFESAQALAVGTLLLAVLGAVRLNNEAGGAVAFSSQVLAALALLALVARPAGTVARDARCLALVAAALLLATSLRGWVITGHDIQAEYLAFQLTDGAQHWQMSAFQNAYNACLSVNILPTVLTQATGLSGLFVFKVLLQLVFALVPVLTFLLSRRFVSRRLALVAAALTMAFPTFFTDMPYLVRQEVAFFFLGLLLLVATGPPTRWSSSERSERSVETTCGPPTRWSSSERSERSVETTCGPPTRWSSSERSERSVETTWRRHVAVALLGVGVVLSHYSTTYLMLIAMVCALLALGLWRVVARRRGASYDGGSPFEMVLLNPILVAFLVAVSLAWAGPATHTGGHASDVVRDTVAAITGKGSGTPGSSDTSYRLFSGEETTPRQRLDLFVKETLAYRQTRPRRELLIKHPGPAELRPDIVKTSKAPLTGLGEWLDSRGLDPVQVNAAAKVGCAALMQVFVLLGLVWLVRRGRRVAAEDPATEDRATEPAADPAEARAPPDEVAFLALGSVAALGLVVLVPNLSVDYGVLRAFQQSLLVLAPMLAVGMWLLLRPFGSRRGAAAALVPVLLLLVLGGAVPSLLGGNQPRIALSNSGMYYDRYYSADPEMQAVSWVALVDRSTGWRSRIIANRNIGVRVLSASDNAAPVADRLYPTLLATGSYVFVDRQVLERGRSTVFYTGDLISYAYPLPDLNRRLDVVYSSPGGRIYR